MELTIIGAASAEPNPGSASSCYLIDAGKGQLVLECGHGASAKLLLHTSIDQVGAVLISHMHPDHFFDLVPLKYFITFNGYPRMPLLIPPTGPPVLEGIAEALGEDSSFWDSAYDIQLFDPEEGVKVAGLDVSMTATHHFIPAWAMRFSSNPTGGVLAYTSDTSRTESVARLASGADLLLAEASIDSHDKPAAHEGHLTAEDAGILARDAGVKRLLITHYASRKANGMANAAAEAFGGPTELACEGAKYII